MPVPVFSPTHAPLGRHAARSALNSATHAGSSQLAPVAPASAQRPVSGDASAAKPKAGPAVPASFWSWAAGSVPFRVARHFSPPLVPCTKDDPHVRENVNMPNAPVAFAGLSKVPLT